MKNLSKQYRTQAVAALMSFRSCEKQALPPAAIIYPLSSTKRLEIYRASPLDLFHQQLLSDDGALGRRGSILFAILLHKIHNK